MAKCQYCEQDMLKAVGCFRHTYHLTDGTEVPAMKAGEGDDWVEAGERCGDCGAKHGHYHHMGCDCERCPICGGQMITCGCDYADEVSFAQPIPVEHQAGDIWRKMTQEERFQIVSKIPQNERSNDKEKMFKAILKIMIKERKLKPILPT